MDTKDIDKTYERKFVCLQLLYDKMKFEQEQVSRRLSMFGTLQGFLFAALGFSWGISNTSLPYCLAALGIAVCLLTYISLNATILATLRIKKEHKKLIGSDTEMFPDIFGYFPDKVPISVFTAPEPLTPLVFVIAWIIIILIKQGTL